VIADVTAVLDASGVERAHYWGYSMGGRTGFGMAKFAPTRVNGLIIGGAHPYGGPGGGEFYESLKHGIAHGRDALIARIEELSGQPIPDAYAKDLREGDLEAWLAIAGQPRENMGSMPRAATPYRSRKNRLKMVKPWQREEARIWNARACQFRVREHSVGIACIDTARHRHVVEVEFDDVGR
jgi:pimeloyl-ACP methyl ester carboxylesterase